MLGNLADQPGADGSTRHLRLKQAALSIMQNRLERCALEDDYSPAASMQHPPPLLYRESRRDRSEAMI
jgi:hypothetical protein